MYVCIYACMYVCMYVQALSAHLLLKTCFVVCAEWHRICSLDSLSGSASLRSSDGLGPWIPRFVGIGGCLKLRPAFSKCLYEKPPAFNHTFGFQHTATSLDASSPKPRTSNLKLQMLLNLKHEPYYRGLNS